VPPKLASGDDIGSQQCYPYLPNAAHIISFDFDFDFDFDFAPNPRMWLCRHSLIEETLPRLISRH
jgi:hypothetical protein